MCSHWHGTSAAEWWRVSRASSQVQPSSSEGKMPFLTSRLPSSPNLPHFPHLWPSENNSFWHMWHPALLSNRPAPEHGYVSTVAPEIDIRAQRPDHSHSCLQVSRPLGQSCPSVRQFPICPVYHPLPWYYQRMSAESLIIHLPADGRFRYLTAEPLRLSCPGPCYRPTEMSVCYFVRVAGYVLVPSPHIRHLLITVGSLPSRGPY